MSSVHENTTAANRSWRQYHDTTMIRLRNRRTGKYLHLSGRGEADIDHAWLGYRRQAKKLLQQHKEAGEPFPYRVAKR